MAEFKKSKLISLLDEKEMLSQDAWDFADACMDDFLVDEVKDGAETMYELRGMLWGYYKGTRRVDVVQTYYSDLYGIAAIIEHLAEMELLFEKNLFDN